MQRCQGILHSSARCKDADPSVLELWSFCAVVAEPSRRGDAHLLQTCTALVSAIVCTTFCSQGCGRLGDCKITWIVFQLALVCLISQKSEYISMLSCAAVSNTCSTKAASTVWSILLLLKLRVTSGMATKRATTSMSPAESQLKSTLAYLHAARLHYRCFCGHPNCYLVLTCFWDLSSSCTHTIIRASAQALPAVCDSDALVSKLWGALSSNNGGNNNNNNNNVCNNKYDCGNGASP